MVSMLTLEQNPEGVLLFVRAHASAQRNSILGVREGALRVAVTATPEKGKANQAITTLLGKALGIAKSRIALVSGEASSKKRLLISGVEIDQLRQALDQVIARCKQ